MAPVPEKPTVAVVGLGYAGIIVAHSLLASGKAHVVGIDRGSAFFHRIASPLAVVDKAFAEKLRLPYAAMFQGADGEFVQGTVERMEEHRVVLADGRTVAFDYAVVATGSTYNRTIDRTCGARGYGQAKAAAARALTPPPWRISPLPAWPARSQRQPTTPTRWWPSSTGTRRRSSRPRASSS